jgi:transitional endoplasmic reticulum ATPase
VIAVASSVLFDLKVKFDYLDAEQVWWLLCRNAEVLGLSVLDAERLRTGLTRPGTLTPGDFVLMARRHRFHAVHLQRRLSRLSRASVR